MGSNILKFSLITLSLLPLDLLAKNYSDYSYKYYFVNGMFTSRKDTEKSRNKLRKELLDYKKSKPNEEVLKYTSEADISYSYNQNESFVTQAFEVYKQKLVDNGEKPSYNKFLFFLIGTSFSVGNVYFTNEMENYTEDIMQNDDDLNTHVDNYVRDIQNGSKFILIAHSQGNFYANFAYDKIFKENADKFKADSLGIVSAGTPASRVKNDENPETAPYVTFTSDKIMNGVRKAFPQVLYLQMKLLMIVVETLFVMVF